MGIVVDIDAAARAEAAEADHEVRRSLLAELMEARTEREAELLSELIQTRSDWLYATIRDRMKDVRVRSVEAAEADRLWREVEVERGLKAA